MGTWKLWGAGIAIMLAATGYAWHSGIISVSGKTAAAANAQAIRPVPVTTSVERTAIVTNDNSSWLPNCEVARSGLPIWCASGCLESTALRVASK